MHHLLSVAEFFLLSSYARVKSCIANARKMLCEIGVGCVCVTSLLCALGVCGAWWENQEKRWRREVCDVVCCGAETREEHTAVWLMYVKLAIQIVFTKLTFSSSYIAIAACCWCVTSMLLM